MVKLKSGNLIRCLPLVLTVVLASMTISGCGGGGGSIQFIPQTPDISALPDQANFGIVVLDKSADKNIQVRNTGNGNLTIGQIALNNPLDDPFALVSDSCSNAVVHPSTSCNVTIRFAPTFQKLYSGTIDIPSNDSDTKLLTVPLAGKGNALNVSIKNVVFLGPTTVQVVVSVRDQFDNPVSTLASGNFSIFEYTVPKGIDTFSNTVSPPISVGMVLDYSSTMIPYTDNVKAASKSFIDLLDTGDEAEIIKFSTDIDVTQTFTDNTVLLKNAIDADFPYVRFGTYLFDAIWTSLNSISLRSNPRHAIIALSDGKDSKLGKTLNEVTTGAVDNNVQIYTIGIGATDNVTLQQLATDTGGQYFYSPTSSDLTTVYSTIAAILSNEYTIEYNSAFSNGQTIFLEVYVNDGGDEGYHSRTVNL